ncbi:MAG: QueT transporter family protein [Oscillospiraceae bacterium]|nr:QueT transporter family protein [Oscillospiraceae bacterium]
MRKFSTKDLTLAAMVAAVYAALTLLLPIPQYGEVQFRIAECMTVLPFLFPWATPGLIVGCFLANLLGSPYVLDWVFGTLATALACFLTAKMPSKWLAPLPPVLCNAVIVGGEIAYSMSEGFGGAFWSLYGFNALSVGFGELVVCYVLGLVLLASLPKIKAFQDLIPEKRLSI